MSITEALVLGFIQGLTEFLPISSSGHLALANIFMGRNDVEGNLAYILILHLATLAAVLLYFWRRIVDLIRAPGREAAALVVATLPIVVVGVIFGKAITATHRMPMLIAVCLAVNGLYLFVADRLGRGVQPLASAPWWKILAIGIAQAIRLPGLSRSGSTIGAGWLCGIDRADAVRFSFLLSIPAILGASVKDLWDLRHHQVDLPLVPIVLGAVTAFGLSLASIRVVEKLSTRNRFLVFAVYSVAAGLFVAAWVLTRGR
ncbi:MAG TPA: undecaprenyl-diphosphate phosphatase [Planctomycetota bacterium]|nr:undecaprenyl-diphosphate phosphatase [Planctomycetota bacterium]